MWCAPQRTRLSGTHPPLWAVVRVEKGAVLNHFRAIDQRYWPAADLCRPVWRAAECFAWLGGRTDRRRAPVEKEVVDDTVSVLRDGVNMPVAIKVPGSLFVVPKIETLVFNHIEGIRYAILVYVVKQVMELVAPLREMAPADSHALLFSQREVVEPVPWKEPFPSQFEALTRFGENRFSNDASRGEKTRRGCNNVFSRQAGIRQSPVTPRAEVGWFTLDTGRNYRHPCADWCAGCTCEKAQQHHWGEISQPEGFYRDLLLCRIDIRI
jgi:hypothetical protein